MELLCTNIKECDFFPSNQHLHMGNCVQDRKFAIKLKEINCINQDLCQSRDKACSYILHILCIYRYDRYLCYIFCAPKDTMCVPDSVLL